MSTTPPPFPTFFHALHGHDPFLWQALLDERLAGGKSWLLDRSDDRFLRFGGDKPLDFGSVRLEIDAYGLRTGNDLRERYGSWLNDSKSGDSQQRAVDAFRPAVARAYLPSPSGGFDDVSFIRAFFHACQGHDGGLPTHYPRATQDGQPGPPIPDCESFKWFVANEREGEQYALPDPASDTGLPTLLERAGGRAPRGGQDQGRDPRRDSRDGRRLR